MTSRDQSSGRTGIDALSRLVETHGGQPSRWPAEARARLMQAGADPELQRKIAEERALDVILAAAPAGNAPGDLAGRILAAVRGTGVEPGAVGSPAPVRPGAVMPLDVARARRVRRPAFRSWPAVAVLAASLALGVFFGAYTPTGTVVDTILALSADQASIDDALSGVLDLGEDLGGGELI